MTINKWSKTKWLIYGCIFIIILFLIFGIAWRIRNNNRPPDEPDQYNNPSIWSNPRPDDRIGPETPNVCFLYQFPSISQNIGTTDAPNYIILPGQPTLNSEVLENITEDELKQIPPDNLRCVDTDQILARRGFQECFQRVNSNIKAVNICTKNDGTKALPGEKQYLYYNDGGINQGLGACPNVRACNGQVSLVSIDYNPDKNRNYAIGCITKDANDNVSLKDCADPNYLNNPLLKNTQLFRLTRMNYGENPYPSDTDQSTGKLASQNGIFAQILERENNTCLRLSEDNNTIQFGTCLGGYSDGNKIGGPYPGFNWIALPTISVDYGATSANYGQQLIYIGNIDMYDFKDIYTGITGFYGYTGTAAWMGYLLSKNARSLRSFQCCGNTDPNYKSVNCNLALGAIIPEIFPDSKSYTAQYFNISNFNLLKKVPGCAYSGPNPNIINCLGL
jgi:hypothetical protein